MGAVERVRELVTPLVEASDAFLYDVEHESGILRVVVDKVGGIDVDTIGDLSQLISQALDEHDPFPSQRYLLEVTSPGVERKLRVPEHFAAQVDSVISVKVKTAIDGVRRFQGRLISVAEGGIDIETESSESSDEPGSQFIPFAEIDQARSVFDWGDTEKPQSKQSKKKSPGKSSAAKPNSKSAKSDEKKASTR